MIVISFASEFRKEIILAWPRQFLLVDWHDVLPRSLTKRSAPTVRILGVEVEPRTIHVLFLLVVGPRTRCFPVQVFVIVLHVLYLGHRAIFHVRQCVLTR